MFLTLSVTMQYIIMSVGMLQFRKENETGESDLLNFRK